MIRSHRRGAVHCVQCRMACSEPLLFVNVRESDPWLSADMLLVVVQCPGGCVTEAMVHLSRAKYYRQKWILWTMLTETYKPVHEGRFVCVCVI